MQLELAQPSSLLLSLSLTHIHTRTHAREEVAQQHSPMQERKEAEASKRQLFWQKSIIYMHSRVPMWSTYGYCTDNNYNNFDYAGLSAAAGCHCQSISILCNWLLMDICVGCHSSGCTERCQAHFLGNVPNAVAKPLKAWSTATYRLWCAVRFLVSVSCLLRCTIVSSIEAY